MFRRLSIPYVVALVGALSSVLAAALDPSAADAAAHQDWSPFVLVAGLILAGFAAERDGIFAFLGRVLTGASRSEFGFFVGTVVLTVVVTAPLNLDTSVAFLTPVFVHAAHNSAAATRRRQCTDASSSPTPARCCCPARTSQISLFSAISTWLARPSSKRCGQRGRHRWWSPRSVLGPAYRRSLTGRRRSDGARVDAQVGVGAAAIVAVTAIVLLARSPAIPVFGVGLAAALVTTMRHRSRLEKILGYSGRRSSSACSGSPSGSAPPGERGTVPPLRLRTSIGGRPPPLRRRRAWS